MAQLFTPRATVRFRAAIILVLAGGLAIGALLFFWARSDPAWNLGKPAKQPIPFQHSLHAGTLGIDCRYCHSTVERAAAAGMPSAAACLTCHSEIWQGASLLEPVRTSAALDIPIPWLSVHRLPAYAYFHHGIHVSAGVACESCHGRVDTMRETVKTQTLSMGWCLDCHRDPAGRIRPQDAVFSMGWTPHDSSAPEEVKAFYREARSRLTDCSTCHR
ncbi:cytochrome c3 family protein [Enterovirga aerilata]|uniref:Cytochrome C n=1 Tax=Enterovirga aerilata TaxID=2730920 RepID=A0A849I2Z8_9HYPH|nr:cytochrome c3 family protein [Enterovirga sp. DB1703]NNM71721.1 cytochrome C [Enterovirga sp. DB1703]